MADAPNIPDEAEVRARWGNFAWTDENQKKANAGVPFHPGALKYFAEKGIKVD